MNNQKKWEILAKFQIPNSKFQIEEIVKVLLKNRGIKTKKEKDEFFNPTPPFSIDLRTLGIDGAQVKRAIKRILKAKTAGEKVIVYGDYDADGICGTAILWETLYSLGLDVLPYIPERFSEGYGLNIESLKRLKIENPTLGLIFTVDHGIVAGQKVDIAKELGIDVVVTDHHLPRTALTSSRGLRPRATPAKVLYGGQVGGANMRGKPVFEYPKAFAIIHTTKISGAAVAWVLAREVTKELKNSRTKKLEYGDGLELVAIGTIADQLPLIGPNRSFAKYGLDVLNKTTRPGLLALYKEAGLQVGSAGGRIGPYEVGFMIAPRINAMGRMEHAIESLRLLCTKDEGRAKELALRLNATNLERQKVVEEVVLHALRQAQGKLVSGTVIVAGEYHEGVIGLAASRLVEEFYRPAIVISKKGEVAKASARSIAGFNIVEVIRKLDDLLLEGGGHPMAAGFSIQSEKIEEFSQRINKISTPLLTEELLTRKLKIDLEVHFSQLNWDLFKNIISFEPTGLGNPTPTFVTKGVEVLDARVVGREAEHLKLKVREANNVFDAIGFGLASYFRELSPDSKVDVAYTLEENTWNNERTLQLKIKDMRIND